MFLFFFFFQAEDGIRDVTVTGVQTCALPILLRVAGEDRSIARETVRRVSLETNSHRGKHALIGAAIGAGGGLGAGIAIDNDCSPNAIVCTGNQGKAILTPAFALLGAGIGALLPAGGWREIYRAR